MYIYVDLKNDNVYDQVSPDSLSSPPTYPRWEFPKREKHKSKLNFHHGSIMIKIKIIIFLRCNPRGSSFLGKHQVTQIFLSKASATNKSRS